MSERIRVIIVDDHTIVRKGLRSLLSARRYEIDVVGEAGDGKEAIQLFQELSPDVTLMDLVMPQMDGLQAIQEIKKLDPKARILVLTSFASDDKVTAALKAGALGYLMKDSSPDELVNTIHSVYLERLSLPQDLARKVILGAGDEKVVSPVDLLTDRELEVLRCVAQGHANKQIAVDLSISTTTVRSHVSNILRKLGLENRTQLAIFAREHGIM